MTSQPSVTSYDSITLENLHTLFFDSLTWGGKFSPGDWRARVKPSPRSPLHTTFTATECTSNYLVCLQAVMWYPNFPLHATLEQDKQWAIGLMMYIGSFYQGLPFTPTQDPPQPLDTAPGSSFRQRPRIWLGSGTPFRGRQLLHLTFAALGRMTHAEIILHFAIGINPPTPGVWHTGRSPRPIRITGLLVEIRCVDIDAPTGHTTVDLSFIRREIEERRALRLVAFAFHNRETMMAAIKQHPVLKEPMESAGPGKEYVFVCQRNYDKKTPEEVDFAEVPAGPNFVSFREWVFVDPVTMEPTGEVMNALLNGPDTPQRDLLDRLLQRHG
ncbi:hypothetical protein BC629DRAFT_1557342 [Irpex lacteus]|nr:hypothetical protein BC629DRAFT_1557342 [Irpex lacteus]